MREPFSAVEHLGGEIAGGGGIAAIVRGEITGEHPGRGRLLPDAVELGIALIHLSDAHQQVVRGIGQRRGA